MLDSFVFSYNKTPWIMFYDTDLVGQYKKNVCQMFADSIS